MERVILNSDEKCFSVDSTKCLIAALIMGILGPAVFVLQPGFVQGMVQYKGFTEAQAGYIASAEMWGIAATTIAMVALASRINWRSIIAIAVIVMAVGNVISTFVGSAEYFGLWRFVVGLGSGALISLSFTIIGLTKAADRNFAYLIMALLSYGAIGLFLMPSAYALVGFDGVLLFFALIALFALPAIRHIPVSAEAHIGGDMSAVELPLVLKVMAVATLLLYFIGQGIVWAYLFLIGLSGGVGEQRVANGLTASQVLGVAGALAVILVGNRFGRLAPLTLGIFGGVGALLALLGEINAITYAIAVCVFNFTWNMTHPYLMAALASFDQRGRLVICGVAAQMLGLAIGPAMGAFSIRGDGYNAVLWLGIGFFVVAFIFIVPPVIKHRWRMEVA